MSNILHGVVSLQSIRSQWQTVTGVDLTTATSDGNRVLNVATAIAANKTAVNTGTSLILRVGYSATTAVTTFTSPTIQVIGVDARGSAHFLINGSGDEEVAMTCVLATDIRDTVYRYSAVNADTIWDLQGSAFFSIAIKVAGVLEEGSEVAPILQYKIV